MHLVEFDNPILRQKAKNVKSIDAPEWMDLINQMFSFIENRGVGLAAPQIGSDRKIFIVNFGEKKVFINSKIVKKFGRLTIENESCLSLPNTAVDVKRYDKIIIEYYDQHMNHRKEVFSGFLSRIIQHEQDHLNGKLIIDYL